MDTKSKWPKRKKLRLQQFDYSTPGAYFITICTHNRKCMLSKVVGAIHESPEIKLTEYGEIVNRHISQVSDGCSVTVNQYIIMPNHIHLILAIPPNEDKRAIRESPLRGRSIISKAIGYIKMNSSKEIHRLYGNTPLWQRGFHDHIIRDQNDYDKIAKYIRENPTRWKFDCFYTEG